MKYDEISSNSHHSQEQSVVVAIFSYKISVNEKKSILKKTFFIIERIGVLLISKRKKNSEFISKHETKLLCLTSLLVWLVRHAYWSPLFMRSHENPLDPIEFYYIWFAAYSLTFAHTICGFVNFFPSLSLLLISDNSCNHRVFLVFRIVDVWKFIKLFTWHLILPWIRFGLDERSSARALVFIVCNTWFSSIFRSMITPHHILYFIQSRSARKREREKKMKIKCTRLNFVLLLLLFYLNCLVAEWNMIRW